MENTAADISSKDNDILGKAPGIQRIFAADMGNSRFLPLRSSHADFGDVDFHQ
jgi:hypothetical protein